MRKLVTLLAGLILLAPAAGAATLDRVKEHGVFKIGYRTDAQPYSYSTPSGLPAGYIVDLCREVAEAVKRHIGNEAMRVEYLAVTAENRFEALSDSRIDILCEPTSMTFARWKLVDFSLMTFIDGASVLYRADGPQSFEDLAGQKVGVHGGTTTETALRATFAKAGIQAEIVALADHNEGLTQVSAGTLSAYFADRAILAFLLIKSDAPKNLRLADQYFSHESYALALPRGDGDFRLLVDRTLAQLYRSGRVVPIYARSFGQAPPSALVQSLFVLNALPD